MKAIRIHNFGGPESLQIDEVNTPVYSESQVLIKVHNACVNLLDLKIASGAMKQNFPITLPWIPGIDFSGTIEAVGSEVKGFAKGDFVYGYSRNGTYSEYLVTSPEIIARKPSSLSFIDAASVATVALTAFQALFTHGNIKEGQTVLIHGGAGSVGYFAIQFARNTGAKIITTASGKDRDFLLSLGADQVINYHTERFEEIVKEVDFVLDTIGGAVQANSIPIIKKGGCLISIVQPVPEQVCKEYGIKGQFIQQKPSTEGYDQLSKLFDSGILKPDAVKIFPYQEAAKSWVDILNKEKVRGRCVIQFIAD